MVDNKLREHSFVAFVHKLKTEFFKDVFHSREQFFADSQKLTGLQSYVVAQGFILLYDVLLNLCAERGLKCRLEVSTDRCLVSISSLREAFQIKFVCGFTVVVTNDVDVEFTACANRVRLVGYGIFDHIRTAGVENSEGSENNPVEKTTITVTPLVHLKAV